MGSHAGSTPTRRQCRGTKTRSTRSDGARMRHGRRQSWLSNSKVSSSANFSTRLPINSPFSVRPVPWVHRPPRLNPPASARLAGASAAQAQIQDVRRGHRPRPWSITARAPWSRVNSYRRPPTITVPLAGSPTCLDVYWYRAALNGMTTLRLCWVGGRSTRRSAMRWPLPRP